MNDEYLAAYMIITYGEGYRVGRGSGWSLDFGQEVKVLQVLGSGVVPYISILDSI